MCLHSWTISIANGWYVIKLIRKEGWERENEKKIRGRKGGRGREERRGEGRRRRREEEGRREGMRKRGRGRGGRKRGEERREVEEDI